MEHLKYLSVGLLIGGVIVFVTQYSFIFVGLLILFAAYIIGFMVVESINDFKNPQPPGY